MQFLLYCFCGGIGVSSDFLVYYFLITFGVGYQVANVLGYLSGTLVSFCLNSKLTFSVKDKVARRLVIFMIVALIGFSVSAAMLWFMVEFMSIDVRIGKLMTLPVVVVIQFFMNRKITFGQNFLSREK